MWEPRGEARGFFMPRPLTPGRGQGTFTRMTSAPTTHPSAFDGVRLLASGRWAAFDHGRLVATAADEAEALFVLYGPEEGPTCSICDALGHGFPGGGPCPLEERGWEEARADEARESGWGVWAGTYSG